MPVPDRGRRELSESLGTTLPDDAAAFGGEQGLRDGDAVEVEVEVVIEESVAELLLGYLH